MDYMQDNEFTDAKQETVKQQETVKHKRAYRNGQHKKPMNMAIDRELWEWLHTQTGPKVQIVEKALRMLRQKLETQ